MIDPFAVDAELRSHLSEALIAQGGFGNTDLNSWLRERLSGQVMDKGALLTDPVVEAAAEYRSSGFTPAQMDKLLCAETRDALLGMPGDEHRFDYPMYTHQLKSWETLSHEKRRSLLVASGTGSGKTECFMVPMLDDLARESAEQGNRTLTGVRAIMLYPLNALIASQKERLDRWTKPFGGRIRYGLYNGLMQQGKADDLRRAYAEAPQETRYRKDLYENPPPILVTNNTMLEYMTIRKQDLPVLKASAGKLRWIIVDEAHSYIGSSAAELSLLLRRVLQAFEVEACDVRFVATSATIGTEDDAGRAALQKFWADIAGIDPENVDVIFGEREPFLFPKKDSAEANSFEAALPAIPAEKRYTVAKSLAENLRAGPLPLADIHKSAGGDGAALLHGFAGENTDLPLLPMRVHKFVRAVPGLWSCTNNLCTGERAEGWPFGAILFEREEVCPHCASLVLEIQGCSNCGEAMLLAHEQGGILSPVKRQGQGDEFSDGSEGDDLSGVEGEDAPRQETGRGYDIMIAGRAVEGARQHGFDHSTGILSDRSADDGIWIAQAASDPCKVCGNKGGIGWPPYRSWRFGMPFLAQNSVPLIVDGVSAMPKPHDNPLPNDGRQVISFTDSRQGTARMAARIETQSERNFVRAFVYHAVQQAGEMPQDAADQSELEAQLTQMKAAGITFGPAVEFLEKQLAEAAILPPGRLSWKTMAERLARSPILEHTIQQVWDQDRELQFIDNPGRLAHFLLLRELGRRPVRANTIETMGLARLSFPVIEKLSETSLPESFRRAGRSLADWKDYLYFLVDQLRGAFAIRMNREEEHWLPGGAYTVPIIRSEEERIGKRDYRWPAAKGHGNEQNAVKALALGLALDPLDPGDRNEINDTLTTAWTALRPLLSAGDTYALDLALSDIEQMYEGWRCPISRRIVPRLVFGRSPNMIAHPVREGDSQPRHIHMPRLPLTFPRTADEKAEMLSFGKTNDIIKSLRHDGLWNAIHDRMLVNAPFVRAEEHSAQQPAWRLRDFEAQFKRGEINMLACSTTMEMGVDIGSIEAVVNTNVPPSIANYRQRVGRAGRRRQGYAFSLTIARDTPLDRETLRDPGAYLARQLRAPKVTMDSRPIVQRHANAMLLAVWLAESGGQLIRIEAGRFFGCGSDLQPLDQDERSPCSEFIDWLALTQTKMAMEPKLDKLVRGTILQGDRQILSSCAHAFETEAGKFIAIWDRFREQMKEVKAEAQAAIMHQASRVCREYLLKELANRALIPGSGFPTAVVPFVTTCRFNKDKNSRNSGQDESPRSKRYDYPSRNADIAIREYAPGAHVVVDGLVWTSAGVALTWKRPVDDADARETQSFKRLWACGKCGEHGTGFEIQKLCSVCGESLTNDMEYLEPAGFRVDWLATPNADTDRAEYIEPEDPLISARESDWQNLLDPRAGRYRASSVGTVFHYSRGPGKSRYDLCLDCGRAAPHTDNGIPALADHDALTPMKGHAGRCSGNDRSFAIKRGIALGFEVQTDVAELQLSGFLKQGTALALGSALREALSRQLGIETRALGLGVRKSDGDLAEPVWSVLLYDQASGGAGYAPRLFDDIGLMLIEARGILQCDCEKACSACVLAPDLFAKQEILDRCDALDCLDAILEIVAEPDAADRAFPDAKLSRRVADDLVMQMATTERFILPISTSFDLSALSREPFSTLFHQAERYGTGRALLLSPNTINDTDEAFRRGLQKLAHRYELDLFVGSLDDAANGALPIAISQNSERVTAWYCRDGNAAIPSAQWGLGDARPVVKTAAIEFPAATLISPDYFDFSSNSSSALEVIAAGQGCAAMNFGNYFVEQHLRGLLEDIGMWKTAELISIKYSDRYLKAPLPMLCAFKTFGALREALSAGNAVIPLTLSCDRASNDREPFKIFHDWKSDEAQDAVAECLANELDFELTIANERASHPRHLQLAFSNGNNVSIYLDQGFGQWDASGNVHFNFFETPEQQAASIFAFRPYIGSNSESYIAAKLVT
ncbi:DEAD/DEAH box helicase [Parasphingorhabdus sp.]|uniref:DEAD/DEAH box helicase n=1 Tax=Parasphingorhabdus sp. TaxID=2709688 RepID=UPI0030035FD7